MLKLKRIVFNSNRLFSIECTVNVLQYNNNNNNNNLTNKNNIEMRQQKKKKMEGRKNVVGIQLNFTPLSIYTTTRITKTTVKCCNLSESVSFLLLLLLLYSIYCFSLQFNIKTKKLKKYKNGIPLKNRLGKGRSFYNAEKHTQLYTNVVTNVVKTIIAKKSVFSLLFFFSAFQ